MPTSHVPDHLHLNYLHITEELQDFSPYLYMMGAYQYSRFFVCTQGSFTLQVGQETYQLRDRDACIIFTYRIVSQVARPTSLRGIMTLT